MSPAFIDRYYWRRPRPVRREPVYVPVPVPAPEPEHHHHTAPPAPSPMVIMTGGKSSRKHGGTVVVGGGAGYGHGYGGYGKLSSYHIEGRSGHRVGNVFGSRPDEAQISMTDPDCGIKKKSRPIKYLQFLWSKPCQDHPENKPLD